VGRIRVLVADGHRIFAEALATALAAEPDIDVAAAGSTQAAERALDRAAAENRPFQVLLVDADLAPGQAPPPPPPGEGRPAMGPGPAAGSAAGSGQGGSAPRTVVQLPAQRRPAVVARVVPPAHHLPSQGAPPRVPPASPAGRPREVVDGIALVGRVRAGHPELRIIVLATDDDPRRAVRALQSGASGWVAKESSLGRLTAIVRGVLRDETHIPPLLLTGVIRELTAVRRERTESERLVDSLTPREKQVLRCMVAGLGRQAVADRLYLSPHTVRTHMQNVLGKLGVHSTLAAVALARRAGVGPVE
jgi:DNA-binding NarL/FixJ family response regulator